MLLAYAKTDSAALYRSWLQDVNLAEDPRGHYRYEGLSGTFVGPAQAKEFGWGDPSTVTAYGN